MKFHAADLTLAFSADGGFYTYGYYDGPSFNMEGYRISSDATSNLTVDVKHQDQNGFVLYNIASADYTNDVLTNVELPRTLPEKFAVQVMSASSETSKSVRIILMGAVS